MTTECSWPIMPPSSPHSSSARQPSTRRRPMTAPVLGTLPWQPAADHPELLGAPVAAALPSLPRPAWVAEIDEDLADTAAFTVAYQVPPAASANCVVVAARRA